MLKWSRIIKVEFSFVLPCDATREQVMEWVDHELGGGGCDGDNPLLDYNLEAIDEPVLTDDGLHLREQVEITKIDGGSIYTRTTKTFQPEPSDLPPASEQISALLMQHYQNHCQGK